MLIARPSPVTLYTTLCSVAGSVVPVGVLGPLGGGTGRGRRVDDGAGVRDGVGELDSGMAGNGGTAVSLLFAPLEITSAMTRPTTSVTAPAATNHSLRGDTGPSGGGGASSLPGVPPE